MAGRHDHRRRNWPILIGIVALGWLGGCDRGRDFSAFDHPASVEALDLSGVTPAEPVTYFELRQQNLSLGAPIVVRVLGSAGNKCAAAADVPACVTRFDAEVSDNEGFQWGGHPADHFKYLAINRGEDVELITSSGAMAGFLGPIESDEEALLTVASQGYWWSADDKSTGGIRVVDDGYEIVCTQLTSMCQPLEVKGYVLLVTPQGEVEILEEWIIEHDENGCT